MNWKSLTPLAVAAVLLLAGAIRIMQAGAEGRDGYALLGAGLLIVGAWLAMEIRGGDDDPKS